MEFDFSIKYDSEVEEFDGLDMYHGSKSMQGLSEVIAIATHGIVNKHFIKKTTAAKGFKNEFKTSFEGSFKQRFKVIFNTERTIRRINEITPRSYIEILKKSINEVIGNNIDLTRRTAIRNFADMYFSEDISHRISTSLKDVHAPIKNQGYKATLYAAQTPIATFNQQTLSYLEEEIMSDERETLIVGISRFNGRTATGRLIAGLDDESFSFVPANPLRTDKKRELARSLYGVAAGRFEPVRVEVTRVTLNNGMTKFFFLHDVSSIDD
ncbi:MULTISPECIES: hypothetical protein [Pseudomonas]|uniref:DUF7946 domain-containing protein n=1 Tax=Pseudomonas TaxID=286 RepID=UPI0012E36C6A|nr:MULTISPECIES: hypothetical protein [Pseudomonas]